MLVLPTNIRARALRELKRRVRKADILGSIALLSGIATLVGVAFGGFQPPAPVSLYCLVALSMVLMSHYCRSYFSEKRQSEKVKSTFEQVHAISESLRRAVRQVHESVQGRGPDVQTREWATAYVETVRRECDSVCDHIVRLFNNLGYPVHRACIKAFDPRTSSLQVVARSNKQAVDENRDTNEPAATNPFFRLLKETHAHYDSHIQYPALQAIGQNRGNGDTRYPRFLAIGDIESKHLPPVLSQIMSGYVKAHGVAAEMDLREDDIRRSLAQRVGQAYNSCLGMMVSSKTDIGAGVQVEDVRGFIGVDSHSATAWEFLDPLHLHVLAGIADSLYCELAFLQEAQAVLRDPQMSLTKVGKR